MEGKGYFQAFRPEKRAILPGKEKVVEGVALERISPNLLALKGEVLRSPEKIRSPEKKISPEGKELASQNKGSHKYEEEQEKSPKKA